MQTFIGSVSFLMLVNGNSTGYFKSSVGMGQGDLFPPSFSLWSLRP